MGADRVQRPPGHPEQGQRVRGIDGGSGRVAGQCLVRPGGRRVQRVGIGQPLVLGQQRRILAGHRGGRLDLGRAEPQRLGLGRPLPLGAGQRVQLGPDRLMPREHPAVVRQQRGQLRAAEPVQRLPLPAGRSSCC